MGHATCELQKYGILKKDEHEENVFEGYFRKVVEILYTMKKVRMQEGHGKELACIFLKRRNILENLRMTVNWTSYKPEEDVWKHVALDLSEEGSFAIACSLCVNGKIVTDLIFPIPANPEEFLGYGVTDEYGENQPRKVEGCHVMPGDPTKCNACAKKGVKLMVCGQCKATYYCSQECQKNDWKLHKPICG